MLIPNYSQASVVWQAASTGKQWVIYLFFFFFLTKVRPKVPGTSREKNVSFSEDKKGM